MEYGRTSFKEAILEGKGEEKVSNYPRRGNSSTFIRGEGRRIVEAYGLYRYKRDGSKASSRNMEFFLLPVSFLILCSCLTDSTSGGCWGTANSGGGDRFSRCSPRARRPQPANFETMGHRQLLFRPRGKKRRRDGGKKRPPPVIRGKERSVIPRRG